MAAADTAWLVENRAERPWVSGEVGHTPGCVCCVARGALAEALGRLFRARAVGAVPFFTRLGAVPADESGAEAVRRVLAADALVSACYRPEIEPNT